jgi:hypothetical protein
LVLRGSAIDGVKLTSGWKIDETTHMILPKRREMVDDEPVPAHIQLNTLTDFVAFLEK